MLTCGLVILNYNNYAMTEGLLDRLQDCSEIDHIVVVDNNSPNDSYAILKRRESSRISVIQSGRNGGYSFGNNVGAKYLIDNFHPDIIGIANPDTEFDGAFVHRIKEVFETVPDYAVLAGFQLTPSGENGNHPFWEQDTVKTKLIEALMGIMIRPFRIILEKIFPSLDYKKYVEVVKHSDNIPHQVWAVEGSLFFIRAEDFLKIGMFDENVFLFYEESIIACKLQKLGRKVGVVNDISFIHAHKEPSGSALERISTILAASNLYYTKKYIFSRRRLLYAMYVFLNSLERIKGKAVRYVKKYFTASNNSL